MNLQELHTLLDYHYWARDRLLDAVERLPPEQVTRDLGNSFPSIRDTLVHLYSADWIWCARWEGESPTALLEPSTFADVATIRRAWKEHERRVRSLLERLGEEGIGRTVEYRTTDGKPQAQVFLADASARRKPCVLLNAKRIRAYVRALTGRGADD